MCGGVWGLQSTWSHKTTSVYNLFLYTKLAIIHSSDDTSPPPRPARPARPARDVRFMCSLVLQKAVLYYDSPCVCVCVAFTCVDLLRKGPEECGIASRARTSARSFMCWNIFVAGIDRDGSVGGRRGRVYASPTIRLLTRFVPSHPPRRLTATPPHRSTGTLPPLPSPVAAS